MEGSLENQFWPYFNEDNTEEEVIDDFLNVLLEVESIDAAERTQHSTKIEGGDAVPVGERAGIANLEGLEIPHVGSLADAADGGEMNPQLYHEHVARTFGVGGSGGVAMGRLATGVGGHPEFPNADFAPGVSGRGVGADPTVLNLERPKPGTRAQGKQRLRWTPQLHKRFVEAVNLLGGFDLATPKGIMQFMGVEGMTIQHVKSHLQKYRLQDSLHGGGAGADGKRPAEGGDGKGQRVVRRRPSAVERSAARQRAMEIKAREDREAAAVAAAAAAAAGEAARRMAAARASGLHHHQGIPVDAVAYPMDPALMVGMHGADELRLADESLVPPGVRRAAPLADGDLLPAGPAVEDDGGDVGSALMKQIEMQSQLHEQLVKQRALQQAIEAHGKYLECILEQQRLRQAGGGGDARPP